MGGGCGRNSIWGAGWLEVEVDEVCSVLVVKYKANQPRTETAEKIRMENAAMVGICVCACIWWYDLYL
jgi:hypothetical protein